MQGICLQEGDNYWRRGFFPKFEYTTVQSLDRVRQSVNKRMVYLAPEIYFSVL